MQSAERAPHWKSFETCPISLGIRCPLDSVKGPGTEVRPSHFPTGCMSKQASNSSKPCWLSDQYLLSHLLKTLSIYFCYTTGAIFAPKSSSMGLRSPAASVQPVDALACDIWHHQGPPHGELICMNFESLSWEILCRGLRLACTMAADD